MTTYTPLGDGVALCLHPSQTSARRQSPSRRVRERRKTGPRRWVLRTFAVPGRPVLDVACPDCPARAVYITEIAATPMAPWLVRTEAREAATGTAERPPEAFGRCTGCGESIRLTDGMIPPHMWPYSTPLLIACSGGGQAPAESNTQAGETT